MDVVDASSAIRSTQRAPKACTACYKAKVKCDKTIPCSRCVARGAALNCQREVVRVQGQIHGPQSSSTAPSWDEISHENKRLRAIVSNYSNDGKASNQESGAFSRPQLSSDKFEIELFSEVDKLSKPRSVTNASQILMPSKETSDKLISYAFDWTFWHHFSLLSPEFKDDHEKLWNEYYQTNDLEKADPLLLSIYFSVLASETLFIGDHDVSQFELPEQNIPLLLKNWYDAALYFLDKADFVQKLDIRIIQTIAILGLVFPIVGDSRRHRSLWSLALRHAQDLRLGEDDANVNESYVDQQKRRRLWWTLVICEWLPVPYRHPCLNEHDFRCELPDEVDDDELCNIVALGGKSRLPKSKMRPIQYHIAMIKLAKIYYRVRFLLRIPRWQVGEIASFVFEADEQLAAMISNLPPHLQPHENPSHPSPLNDHIPPWVSWQRKSISMALLYYRICIGRLLQTHWLDGSINGTRTRAISISSAQGMINTTKDAEIDPSKMRLWAGVVNIYTAIIHLIIESNDSNTDFTEEIGLGLKLLRSIQPYNIIASQSIQIIEDVLSRNGRNEQQSA